MNAIQTPDGTFDGQMRADRGPLPDAEYLQRRTVAERVERGRSARRDVPLDRHARWRPPEGRADPLEILERQARLRDPELVPLRHGRMALSPFAFYRGGAAIMAADLAGTPVARVSAQLCGDAHLLNFGMFETPERSLVFGLNDFDETLRGPFEWDVKRLAASIEVAGQGPRPRPARPGTGGPGHRGRLPGIDARVRVHAQPRGLVRAAPGQAPPAVPRASRQASRARRR